MAQQLNINGVIHPTGNADPTHDEQYNLGGYRSISTISARNQIPTDRKSTGMLVYVTDDNELWQWSGNEWILSEVGQGYPNVKVFGAKGDNLTDDTMAFKNAVVDNFKAFVPDGTYKVNFEELTLINYFGNGMIYDTTTTEIKRLGDHIEGTLFLQNNVGGPTCGPDGVLNIGDGEIMFFPDLNDNGTADADMYGKANLVIGSGMSTYFKLNNDSAENTGIIRMTSNASANFIQSGQSTTGSLEKPLIFSAVSSSTPQMVIDPSGRVGIGNNTTLSKMLTVTAVDSAAALLYNPTGDTVYSYFKTDGSTGNVGTGAHNNDLLLLSNDEIRLRVDASAMTPETPDGMDLGSPSHKFNTLYAVTGTIDTSDERKKQDIEELDDAEKRVAVTLKGLIRKFRFKDAVEAKGDDARIHIGIIAQTVVSAFADEGLDATRYGMLCHDDAEEEGGEDIYGIRYTELLAFIISAL